MLTPDQKLFCQPSQRRPREIRVNFSIVALAIVALVMAAIFGGIR